VSVREVDLHLEVPFTISRHTRTEKRVVVVEEERDGRIARGEASPDQFFGESSDSVRRDVEEATELLPSDPLALQELHARLDERFAHGGAAACAIDTLAYDRAAQSLGVPLYRMLGLDPRRAPPTSFTIGLAEPEVMAERAVAAAERGFQVLKVKLGAPNDVAIVRKIRERYRGRMTVDPNAAWDVSRAARTIDAIVQYGIEFVEQPLRVDDLEGLETLAERARIPIVVDETVVRASDVPKVAGIAQGINVKLQKCGGVGPALDLIAAARANGLKVMLGCRAAETSVAIAAAAHLAPLVDWADLDGNLLITDDPFRAVDVRDGRFVYPDRPGLGAVPRDA
jgi:L-alanine-DL-glutamate epimerase-like enolase superfamily enzyme